MNTYKFIMSGYYYKGASPSNFFNVYESLLKAKRSRSQEKLKTKLRSNQIKVQNRPKAGILGNDTIKTDEMQIKSKTNNFNANEMQRQVSKPSIRPLDDIPEYLDL